MKRLFLISMLLLLVAATMIAQGNNNARKILDRTSAVVGNKGGATASFTLSGGKLGKQQGTIAIKGNRFYVQTTKTIVWFDGKTQWTYLKGGDEVNVSSPNAAQQQAMNPYTFIRLYRNGYNLTSKTKGKGYMVHLLAQNKKQGLQELYITVDAKYRPTQVKMKQASGWITIDIKNFKTANLNDAKFKFNAKEFPKLEVIDLR